MNSPTPLQLIRTTLLSYRGAAADATKGLKKNWIILPASIVAYMIFVVSMGLLAPFGFAGGLIAGLIHVALLSLYY